MPGYTKNVWSDRAVSTPNKYTKSGETSTSVTLIQDPGTITNAGTPVTAAKMNNIEQGIADAVRKDGSEPMTGVLNNTAGYQWNGITMVQTRVHSSGTYIEWNNGGTWYPVGGISIGASNTVQESSLPVQTLSTAVVGNVQLAAKLVPKGTGDLTIEFDIKASGSGGNVSLGAFGGTGDDSFGTASSFDYSMPLGTVISSNPNGVVLAGPVSNSSFQTVQAKVRVYRKMPIYIYIYSGSGISGAQVQNIKLKYDVLG